MIKLDKQQSDELSRLLQQYCETELDYELGQFEAQFMLDFIADKIAPHFYNQGIRDA